MTRNQFAVTLWGIVLISCLGLVGCGGGSTTATQPVTPPPTGPASGSEFLYNLYFASDLMVARIDPATGVIGATVDATPGLGPAPEYGSAVQFGKFLYVLGFDQNEFDQNLWIFSITGANGELSTIDNSPFYAPGGDVPFSQSLLIDTTHGRLYTSGVDSPDGFSGFFISPYTIDSSDGSLSLGTTFNEQPIQGTFIPTPIIDPLGRFIYEFAFDAPNPQIFVYVIDATTGSLSEAGGSPFPLSSPLGNTYQNIQLLPSPSGDFLNVICENGKNADFTAANNIYVYSVDSTTGALAQVNGSPFATQSNLGTPMVFSPSGEFLYGQFEGTPPGNPGFSLQTYAVDPANGSIGTAPVSSVPFKFGIAEDSQFDPSGNALILAAQIENDATAYSFTLNKTTGALTPAAGSPFTLPNEASPPSTTYQSSLIVKIP